LIDRENKARLSGGFMAQFSTQQLFGNSAEEFYLHETLSAPIKLSSPLSSSIQCYVSVFNVHETL
jgi:hypothetical protein